MPFYGYNLPDAKSSRGIIDSFWAPGMPGSLKDQYDCIKQFSETTRYEGHRPIPMAVFKSGVW